MMRYFEYSFLSRHAACTLLLIEEPEPDIRQNEDSRFIRFAKTLRGLVAALNAK
jgi:hypothetical protein